MSQRRVSFGFSAWFLLAGAALACGSLDDGAIEIVDEDDGGTNGGGTAGKSSGGGDTSRGGAPEPSGGGSDGGSGEGGEPPIVISDDPPTVVSVSPEDEANDAEPTTKVVVEFSESLDEASLEDAIVVKDGDEEVSTKVAFAGTKATLTFPRRLDLLATYTVNVSTAVKDLAGIPLESPFSSSFRVRDGKWGSFVTLSNAGAGLTGIDSYPFPAPVFDARGNALFVWAQSMADDLPLSVWARAYNSAKGWGTSQKISAAATACNLPSVATNQAGDAVIAWKQIEGSYSRIFARRFISGTWEPTPHRVDISNTARLDNIVTVMTETGDAHVLWQYESSNYKYVAGNVARGTGEWDTADTYIAGQFESLSGPSVAFNPDGSGFAVWVGSNAMISSVHVARYLPKGGWGNKEVISGGAGAYTSTYSPPEIAVDASGNAMAAWRREGDVATTRFTKASGWSAVVTADGTATGSIADWSPRLASYGGDFAIHWHQSVGSISNAFANLWTGGQWGAPVLLSDGDTEVHYFSGTAFGLDRHGNALATWIQGADVRFARLAADDGEWAPNALVATLEAQPASGPTEHRGTLAANGMFAVVYSKGYPYERHDALYSGIFE